MTKVRIAGAIASKTGATLYLEDGKTLELNKNNHRTHQILETISKPLAQKKIVEIDLSTYEAHHVVERKTGGFIKFAIQKVKSFLAPKGRSEPDPELKRIIATGGTFGMQTLKEDETVVATVGDKQIPGAQALSRQIEAAAFTKDCAGFRIFMERLASVIDERGHSVQELLRFMERADLPIADDGTIVAYKTLNCVDEKKRIFVDCHSKRVRQKVGSRVSMPLAAVDPSRRTQCSTGLHIARRKYLRGYFGDLLTLVKVAPEDVIAVPYGEPDKMRAMAYHIVAEVPKAGADLIRQDKPMTTDEECAMLLADVIAGNHIGVLEEVRIGERKEDAEDGYDKEIEVEEKTNVTPFLGGGRNGLAAALDTERSEREIDVKGLNKAVEEAIGEAEHQPPSICSTDGCEAIISDSEEICDACREREEEEEAEALEAQEREEAERAAAQEAEAKEKAKKAASKPKAASPAPKPEKALSDAAKRREEAYQAVIGGMSQREAAKTFSVCAKTLRKMVNERAQKAAE